jgi:hypothetical protein
MPIPARDDRLARGCVRLLFPGRRQISAADGRRDPLSHRSHQEYFSFLKVIDAAVPKGPDLDLVLVRRTLTFHLPACMPRLI